MSDCEFCNGSFYDHQPDDWYPVDASSRSMSNFVQHVFDMVKGGRLAYAAVERAVTYRVDFSHYRFIHELWECFGNAFGRDTSQWQYFPNNVEMACFQSECRECAWGMNYRTLERTMCGMIQSLFLDAVLGDLADFFSGKAARAYQQAEEKRRRYVAERQRKMNEAWEKQRQRNRTLDHEMQHAVVAVNQHQVVHSGPRQSTERHDVGVHFPLIIIVMYLCLFFFCFMIHTYRH